MPREDRIPMKSYHWICIEESHTVYWYTYTYEYTQDLGLPITYNAGCKKTTKSQVYIYIYMQLICMLITGMYPHLYIQPNTVMYPHPTWGTHVHKTMTWNSCINELHNIIVPRLNIIKYLTTRRGSASKKISYKTW